MGIKWKLGFQVKTFSPDFGWGVFHFPVSFLDTKSVGGIELTVVKKQLEPRTLVKRR